MFAVEVQGEITEPATKYTRENGCRADLRNEGLLDYRARYEMYPQKYRARSIQPATKYTRENGCRAEEMYLWLQS